MSVVEDTALGHFESGLSYPLDEFQRVSCQLLEEGSGVLVAAPTGSGKTTVAEFAVYLARRERNHRVVYTTPIKALSNQKYRELCSEYGSDQVGLLTGDTNINGDAPIVIMTTEVLRNMIYERPEALSDLGFVILDEVHYLGDRFRGAVWEEIILHLPQHILIVSLSATVSNAEELGDWIHTVRGNTEVIISERRPVPLFHHVLTTKDLLPLYTDSRGRPALAGKLNPQLHQLRAPRVRSRGKPPRRHRAPRVTRSAIALALDETKLLPAITFIFSRTGCEEAVRQCVWDGVSLTTSDERRRIRERARHAISHLTADEQKVLRIKQWIGALERGIAAHHAGMLPMMKEAVEELFQEKLVKLVFATETLALGLNMPAKAVVIERLEKFNGEARVPLTSGEFTQLTGRAGRRGIDDEGHAIVVWHDGLDPAAAAQLAGKRSFPVQSSFRPTFNMAVNLLAREPRSRVRETLERSFGQFQTDRALVADAEELRQLTESLEGYQRAISHADSHEGAERWKRRAATMQRRIKQLQRKVQRSAGGLAREFDSVTDLLLTYDYLNAESDDGEHLIPTEWGVFLQRIYGDHPLLLAETVRRGIWSGLTPEEIAALACAITYEHRRGAEFASAVVPGPRWDYCFFGTLAVWEELDHAFQKAHLPRPEMPDQALSGVIHLWASGASLADTLTAARIVPGDFVRVAKQAVDLCDHLSAAARALAERTVDPSRRSEMAELAASARSASRQLKRDIVDTQDADGSGI